MSKQTITTTNQRIDELEAHIIALTEHIQAQALEIADLKANGTSAPSKPKARDYGPDSTRAMDDHLALQILVGKYRNETVRNIAKKTGLSHGQIYSLRGEYTMKAAWKTARAIIAKREERQA